MTGAQQQGLSSLRDRNKHRVEIAAATFLSAMGQVIPTSGRSARFSRLSLGHGYPYCRWHWVKPTQNMLQWSILLSKIIGLDPRRQTDSETEYILSKGSSEWQFFRSIE